MIGLPALNLNLLNWGGGFRVWNRIVRARFVKRAPAEHTAVADTAGAIFALIA